MEDSFHTSPNKADIGHEAATSDSILLLEEQLEVGKRVVETGGVRLIKTVHHDEQTIAIPLLAEQIDVERVAMDQLLDEVPPIRQEGDTTIYPVLQEEYVVQKRLRLVEEIRVTKRQVQTTDEQTLVLRREEMTIERTKARSFNERSDSPSESSL